MANENGETLIAVTIPNVFLLNTYISVVHTGVLRQIFFYRSILITARIALNKSPFTRGQHMPEQRGKQATAEVKSEWTRAYQIYLRATGDRYDKKKDRTSRIDSVAKELQLTRKQAKRRVRNYEAWQRNIKKGLVEP